MATTISNSMHGTAGPEAEEKLILQSAASAVRLVEPRQDILWDGEVPSDSYLILHGWGISYKDLSEGRRQILAFLMPGDLCVSAPNKTVHHSIASLTAMRYAVIPLTELERAMERPGNFAKAVWRQQLAASSMHLAWIANSGRPAYEALAHLLCEIYTRAQVVGLADDKSCDFPLTQFDLACALGLTSVHINRTLQQMRRDGLIELRGRKLLVLDSKRLSAAAQFDRGYLHLAA